MERFTSWLTEKFSNSLLLWTLTLPGQDRSIDASVISKAWNSLNTNFLSEQTDFIGWARYLELHANGVPHLHVLLVPEVQLTPAEIEQRRRLFRLAALSHGFGPQTQLIPAYRTPKQMRGYLSKQAKHAVKMGSRPINLANKHFFAASRSLNAKFKHENPKGVARHERRIKLAKIAVSGTAKGIARTTCNQMKPATSRPIIVRIRACKK